MMTYPNTPRGKITGLGLLFILIILAACAPQMAPEVPKTVVITQEVLKEGETVIETQTVETVITPEPEVSGEIRATPGLPAVEEPSLPGMEPTVVVEARQVELEWPATLRLGDSDVIRLALIPAEGGYILQSDFPEHRIDQLNLEVIRPQGYDLWAIARLDGVGFDLSPEGEQARFLAPGDSAIWRWSVRGISPGQHRLSVSMLLRWTPLPGSGGSVREAPGYSRSLEVRVTSFFGLNRTQAMTGGLVGLFLGSGLSLLAIVSLRRPRQTPAVVATRPNPDLVIEPSAGLALTPGDEYLLRTLFRRYGRLVLESEFLSGYSGARTLLALPIRPDGRADAYTIVKLGMAPAIQREYENYELFVKDTLPPVTARIQQPPVITPVQPGAASWGALQYTFIAAPGQVPVSLRQRLLENPDPELVQKIFTTFGPNWWMQRQPYTFRLAKEYDRLLPTHYVLEPVSGRGPVLDGHAVPGETSLSLGELVTLRNFEQIDLRADGRSLSLKGSPQPGQPALRVRWLGLNDPLGATGRVVANRNTLLREATVGMDSFGLPDPLLHLSERLAETVSGTQSTIHGDLNLENVLVGPGGFVWLIDFAMTRPGHPLFDFAHLEAELIAHVYAPYLGSPEAYHRFLMDQSGEGAPGLSALRDAVREIARQLSFNPTQPREYHLALAMACLGALKYTNLTFNQKHCLYLTAASLELGL